MPRILTIFAAVAVLLMGASAEVFAKPPLAPTASESAYELDELGPYRVAFPPHRRVVGELGGTRAAAGQLGTVVGLGLHLSFDADFPDEEIWWRLRHHSNARLYPGLGLARVELVNADYLRHDTSSYVLIPAERDIRLPAPFDIVVMWSLGGADLDVAAGGGEAFRALTVGSLRLMADFVRDPTYRHRFAVGAPARYDIAFDEAETRHSLAPLSGLSLFYGWESPRGLFQFSGLAETAYVSDIVAGSPDPRWRWRADASARFEWIPVAVNDFPLSVFADATWTYDHAAKASEYGAHAGIRASVPLP